MTNELIYKVLWVEDNQSIVDSTQRDAEEYSIELDHYTNWREAAKELEKHFSEYSAIILDANCKLDADSLEENYFIGGVLPELSELFGRKHETKPWYILSAGIMQDFNTVIQIADKGRKPHEEDWGSMLYLKEVADGPQSSTALFTKIKEVAQKSTEFKIKAKYKEAFDRYPNQRDLLKIVMYLENDVNNNPSVFTDIRKELEWIMPYCTECGILQGVKFSGTNLAQCSKALGNDKLTDIIPIHVQRSFHAAVSIANPGCHRSYIDEAVKNGEAPFLVRSIIFELLNIIHWLNTLPVNESERTKLKEQVSALLKPKESGAEYFEGKEWLVEQDEDRNYHCGECLISFNKAEPFLGKRVTLYDVQPNDKKSKDIYPFFAYFIPIEEKD